MPRQPTSQVTSSQGSSRVSGSAGGQKKVGSDESQGVLPNDPSVQKHDKMERLSSAHTRGLPRRLTDGAKLNEKMSKNSSGQLFLALGKSPYQENLLRRMQTQKAKASEEAMSKSPPSAGLTASDIRQGHGQPSVISNVTSSSLRRSGSQNRKLQTS